MRRVFFLSFLAIILLGFSSQNVMALPGDVRLVPDGQTVGIDANFTQDVIVDSGNSELGVYQFTVTYDPNLIIVDTTQGTSGVDPGPDGFITVVNPDTPGQLVINGFDLNGTGPGPNLHVLTIYFKTVALEPPPVEPIFAEICIIAEQLADPLGATIGDPNGNCVTVEIRTGENLTVAVSPSCDNFILGTVESNPPGINCPTDCNEQYETGTPVTLTAIPARGNIVVDRWEGDCAGTIGFVCNLTMDTSKNAQVFFKVLVGDVDCNGQINIIDALLVARRAAGLPMDQTNWCGDQPGPFFAEEE